MEEHKGAVGTNSSCEEEEEEAVSAALAVSMLPGPECIMLMCNHKWL